MSVWKPTININSRLAHFRRHYVSHVHKKFASVATFRAVYLERLTAPTLINNLT